MIPIETMLIATLSGQEKNIILQKRYEFSDKYNVIIDNDLQALVCKIPRGKGWEVVPKMGSWLTADDCEVILKTVLNLENPNV